MLKKYRLMVIDDHTLMRLALRALLSQDPDIEVVAEADNGRDAISAIAAQSPDLVLMDLSMPGTNGIEAILEIKLRNPGIKVLVVTLHKTDEYMHASLKAGADGYITKDASASELRTAIRGILKGTMYFSPEVATSLVNGYRGANEGDGMGPMWKMLTHRERQVLKLVAEGYSNKHIAEYLGLRVNTVETHRANLMRKLDRHNVAQLTSYAIENGLISPG